MPERTACVRKDRARVIAERENHLHHLLYLPGLLPPRVLLHLAGLLLTVPIPFILAICIFGRLGLMRQRYVNASKPANLR